MNLLRARFPDRRLAVSLLRRGFAAWLLVRLVLAAAPLLMGQALTRLDPSSAAVVVAIAWFIGVIQARLRNEPRFFANLGIAPGVTALLSVAPAVLAEIALGVLAAG